MAENLFLRIGLEAVDRMTRPLESAGRAAEIMSGRVRAATGRVRTLDRASRDIGAFERLAEASRANGTALDAARTKFARLEAAMEAGLLTTRAQRQEFERVRSEVDRLTRLEDQNTRQTERLTNSLREAGVDTNALAEAQQRLQRELADARAEAERQSDAFDRLNNARSRMEDTFARRDALAGKGAAMGAAGGLALAGMGGLAQAGIEFEAIMSKVAAVARLDTAGAEFANLQAQAEALGASTAFSATQAAEGMTYLGMAGFNARQILDAMPGTLALATAAGSDLGETANIASNILSGFGLEAAEMGRVGDVLTGTFTRSNTSLSSLGETMKYLAPIAKQAGMSLEESAAMAGLLGNIGISGSEAGTALKAIVNRMAALPKSAADALEALKIKTTDAAGNMRPIIDILSEVAEKTEKMGSGTRLSNFAAIAGEEAGGALAALVDQAGAKGITQFVDVLKGTAGEAEQVARTMADNIKGDLDGMSSAWEGLNIALLFTSKGPLRELIQSASSALSTATTWVKANPELAGTLLKVAAGLAAAAVAGGSLALMIAGLMGPFAVLRYSITTFGIIGPSLSGLGAALVSGLGKAITFVIGGIRALSLALFTSPLGLIVLGLAGAAFLLIRYWEPVKAFFGGLWEGLKAGLGPAFEAIDRRFAAVKDALSFLAPAFDLVGQAIGGFVGWISGLLTPVDATAETLDGARAAGLAFGQALGTLPAMIGLVWDGLVSMFSFTPLGLVIEHWSPISEFFANLWDGILGGFHQAMSGITSAWSTVKGWFGADDGPQIKVPSLPGAPAPLLSSGIVAMAATSGSSVADVARGFGPEAAPRPIAIAPSVSPAAVVRATSPAVQAASARPSVTYQPSYDLVINAPPGLDEQALARALARAVRRELDAREAAERSRARAALYDTGGSR